MNRRNGRYAVTRIIAVGNQKGGVGKTSTTLGLAAAARAAGARALVIDLDPQANATDVLAGVLGADYLGSYGLLADAKRGGGVALGEVIQPAGSAWSGVDLVGAIEALSDVDTDTGPTQPLRLQRAMSSATELLAERYDVVLLDCPPSLGRILIAALVAATDVVIVTEPGGHALRGVGRLEESMTEVREGFAQPHPTLLGIIVNRVKRASEHAYRDAELREAYGALVFAGGIPERIAVADAASSGRPVHDLPGEGASAVSSVLNGIWTQLQQRISTTEASTERAHQS
jgi:chromosome partitioning protein